jgi:hypothetical protein
MVEWKPQALKYKELSNTRFTSFYISPVATFSAHCPLYKSCPTHGRWLVDGGKTSFLLASWFFLQQMKFEEYGKNKQNIPRG